MNFLTSQVDLSGIPLPLAIEGRAEGYNHYGFSSNTVHPESEAIHFYLSNHAQTLLDGVETDEAQMLREIYIQLNTERGLRMYYYLLGICAQEARYLNDLSGFMNEYGETISTWPDGLVEFWKKVNKSSSSYVHQRLEKNAPADTTLGQFVDSISYMFGQGNWSSAYGGPKWQAITDTLREFIRGQYSLEMLLDTAWTLVHNTGPIFNKGFLYHSSGQDLDRILDIQRAGELPNWVKSGFVGTTASNINSHSIVTYWNNVEQVSGRECSKEVDWVKVQQWGAGKISYQNLIQKYSKAEFFQIWPGKSVTYEARQ